VVVARQPTRTSRNHGRLTGTPTPHTGTGRRSGDRNRCVNACACACVRPQATEPAIGDTKRAIVATDLTDAAVARWTGGSTRGVHHYYTGAGAEWDVQVCATRRTTSPVGGRVVTTAPADATAILSIGDVTT